MAAPMESRRRMQIAHRVAADLRRRHGRRLLGVGVYGSVARAKIEFGPWTKLSVPDQEVPAAGTQVAPSVLTFNLPDCDVVRYRQRAKT